MLKIAEENVKNRLEHFIKSMNMPVYKFEQLCGLSQGYVANIRKSISPGKLSLISEQFPNLNVSWLMTGEGTMKKEESNASDIFSTIDAIKSSIQPVSLNLFETEDLQVAQKNIAILVNTLNVAYAQLRLACEMYSELQNGKEKVVAYLPKDVVGEL